MAQELCNNGNCLGSQFIRPGFRDQGRTSVPLASHSEAEDETKHRQHEHGGRKPGSERTDRISQDAEHQGALASNAVGKKAEQHTANAGGQQGERVQKASGRLRHAQIAHHVRQDQRVKHGVKSVKHPAESRRQQCAALLGGRLLQELDGTDGHAESDCISGWGTGGVMAVLFSTIAEEARMVVSERRPSAT
jgi:hypothetical protein